MNLILNQHPNKNTKNNDNISFIPEGTYYPCRLTEILNYQFYESELKSV